MANRHSPPLLFRILAAQDMARLTIISFQEST